MQNCFVCLFFFRFSNIRSKGKFVHNSFVDDISATTNTFIIMSAYVSGRMVTFICLSYICIDIKLCANQFAEMHRIMKNKTKCKMAQSKWMAHCDFGVYFAYEWMWNSAKNCVSIFVVSCVVSWKIVYLPGSGEERICNANMALINFYCWAAAVTKPFVSVQMHG